MKDRGGGWSSSDPQSPAGQARKAQWALLASNTCFGVGAVVGALGLPATHPLVFALIREVWAGLILLAISIYCYQPQAKAKEPEPNPPIYPLQIPKKHTSLLRSNSKGNFKKDAEIALEQETQELIDHDIDPAAKKEMSTAKRGRLPYALHGWYTQWKYFCLLGLLVFGNQAGFIVGIKMAGPVTASVWQPSQPIFTAAIGMTLGWEPLQSRRLVGVGIAFVGCVAMVLLKPQQSSAMPTVETLQSDVSSDPGQETDDTLLAAGRYMIGNGLFFTNCLCTALYILLSKRMLALYPSLMVAAWSYSFASVYMCLATILAAAWPNSDDFFCPECTGGMWEVPPEAIPALLYYICFASVTAYGLMTWANQHATGTLVMSFSVLQPVTATLLTVALLALQFVPSCQPLLVMNMNEEVGDSQGVTTQQLASTSSSMCLDFPNSGTFCGMIGVFVGLGLIISTESSASSSGDTIVTKDIQDNDHDSLSESLQEFVPLTNG